MWSTRMRWYCRDCWWQGQTDPAKLLPTRYLSCPHCQSEDLRSAPVQVYEDDKVKEAAALPRRVPIPISRPRWWETAHSAEVPLMFLIKGSRAAPQGADVPPPETPAWDAERALAALKVTAVPFDAAYGTADGLLGYAKDRTIAVSPTSPLPHLTRFHELAHVVLGHTTERELSDSALTQRSLRECEAEAVAIRCCLALGLPGVESSGRYIRHWWATGRIPRQSAVRILNAVDQILKAGASSSGDDEGQS